MPSNKGNQSRIVRYILNSNGTSKAMIAQDLNLSMPTVLQNLKQLSDEKIVREDGTYESTGGRKAKTIVVSEDLKYSIGVDITRGHVGLALINFKGQLVCNVRKRIAFDTSISYCKSLSAEIESFIEESGIDREKILGVGISLAGIVDNDTKIMTKSHALQVENFSLKNFEQAIPFPVYFENDANAALMAEKTNENENSVYISLSNTVGGAICLNGNMYSGMSKKAGEIGHMIIHPGDRKCYCGKVGCADSYLSALCLKTRDDMTLEEFMECLENKDEECVKIWDQYLNELAILITNLRALFDSEIIIGGYVGYYLANYMYELGTKITNLSIFDTDISYIRACVHKCEASAVGVAMHFIDKFVDEL